MHEKIKGQNINYRQNVLSTNGLVCCLDYNHIQKVSDLNFDPQNN